MAEAASCNVRFGIVSRALTREIGAGAICSAALVEAKLDQGYTASPVGQQPLESLARYWGNHKNDRVQIVAVAHFEPGSFVPA